MVRSGRRLKCPAATRSDRWGTYDPTDGHLIAGAVLDELDNGTYTYSYGIPVGYLDPAGALDLGIDVNVKRDSDGSDVAHQHFIRRYNLTGSLQWTSHPFDKPSLLHHLNRIQQQYLFRAGVHLTDRDGTV